MHYLWCIETRGKQALFVHQWQRHLKEQNNEIHFLFNNNSQKRKHFFAAEVQNSLELNNQGFSLRLCSKNACFTII